MAKILEVLFFSLLFYSGIESVKKNTHTHTHPVLKHHSIALVYNIASTVGYWPLFWVGNHQMTTPVVAGAEDRDS